MLSKCTHKLKLTQKFFFIAICLGIGIKASAQSFVPAVSLGGNPNPPQSHDIVNSPADGNVGIGQFPGHPNPPEKLTVGGNISLYPDFMQAPTSERKISAHDGMGLIGIYSKDFDQCQGAGIRLNAVNNPVNPGMVDLFSTGVSAPTQGPAFLFTTYEPCNPFRRMVITREGLAGFGSDIDGTTLDINDRLSVENSLALISSGDADDRYIRAHSLIKSLNIMVNSSPLDGAGIELFGKNIVGQAGTFPTPAGITFTAFQALNVQNALAYKFMQNTSSGSAISFSIDQMGMARFGPFAPASERLTVDGDVYLAGTSTAFRKIVSHASTGGIDICPGTSNTDGSRIRLNAGASGQILFNSLGTGTSSRGFTFNGKAGSAAASDILGIDVDGKAHFSNDIDFSIAGASNLAHNIKGGHNSLNLYSKTSSTDGSGIELSTASQRFSVPFSGSTQTSIFKFDKYAAGTYTNIMNLYSDGKVTIGNIIPPFVRGNYGLYVEKGIMTESVNVAVNGTGAWNDAVFEADYVLRPLEEVASYTAANKHLPEIPSAEEVVKNGLDLGAMQSLLLKKVEELTLYAIQQQKTIAAQAADLQVVKTKLAELSKK